MGKPVRVLLERGAKRRIVACAFDWPGWDRSARLGAAAHGGESPDAVVLAVLESYRPRYAAVAERAGYGAAFAEAGPLQVVEELAGIGMTDYYGLSGRAATPETTPMTDDECARKVALLEAAWATFDDTAGAAAELRLGPRGGGRSRDEIVRHVNRAEIGEFAPKVGVTVPLETVEDADALHAYRRDVADAIREHHAQGLPARSWPLPFLIRRLAWHMLDHAWEIEDRSP